jgi:diguanylate cyclase
MTIDVEALLRGPTAYSVIQQVLELLERHRVWPTPLNIEIWTHFVADPDGALGRELSRLLAQGEAFTENVSDDLATNFLPRSRLNEQIRDAGQLLNQELLSVSQALQSAQINTSAYGQALDGAGRILDSDIDDVKTLQRLVQGLSAATRGIQKENETLSQRIETSTAEVTRLKEHLEQVRRDASTDGLTNLSNRRTFDDELERLCKAAADAKETLSLAVIDIDHFKKFNDTWGHQVGDQVIRYVASILGKVGVPPRLAARYGGEEFAVIFPGESAAEVEELMNASREQISSRQLKRRSTAENLGVVTVSSGIAQLAPGETPASLLGRADAALYASKRGGRNRVTNAEIVGQDQSRSA